MANTDTIIVDKENMQVDRSTPLGQAFDKIQKAAEKEKNPAMSQLMNQVLAYTEASIVIDETVEDPKQKEEMLGKLRSKME